MAGSSIFASNRSSSSSESGCVGVLINDPHRKREASGNRVSLPEESFLAALSDRARELGIFLYVFRPEGLDAGSGSLSGYRRKSGGWQREEVPLPAIVYDRSSPLRGTDYRACRDALQRLSAIKPFILLNGRLPGKCAQYEALHRAGGELAELAPPQHPIGGREHGA